MKHKKQLVPLLITLTIGIASVYLHAPLTPPNPTHSKESTKKTITLADAVDKKALQDGSSIEGTYIVKKDQALLYSVSNAQQKIIASGVIAPDSNGAFSRNLSFDQKVEKGENLQLKIYAQDKKGAIVDELTLPIVYKG